MYASLVFSSLLTISTVHASAIPLDSAPAAASLNKITETATVNAAAQASAYIQGLALSGSPLVSGNVTADAIRLVGFEGCDSVDGIDNAVAQIYSGWQQAQKIMDIPSLHDGNVDFNTAGAVDYLGAPGLNSARQGDMNQIFKTFSTLKPAWWLLGWRIHVRCDDPKKKCLCPGTGSPYAYTNTKDPESGLARINFCPLYFGIPSLNDITDGSQNLPAWQKYDMNRYWRTQGHVWAHELMHIDWVTNAGGRYGTNQHVTDLFIQFTDASGRKRAAKAYGPTLAKILARWPTNTGDFTIRNADSLALFMTSQYVQSQLDNAYPHYPLVNVDRPDSAPFQTDLYNTLFIFNTDGSVTLNDTNPLSAEFVDGHAPSQCETDEEDPNPEPVVFSSFAPDSAYPTEYVASLHSWIASETGAPDPIMTEGPGQFKSGDTYCVPFQDPDDGIDGYCQCSDGADFSFAKGDNPCPYTSPGPASATINPSTITSTTHTSTPASTQTSPPANASPVIGDPCEGEDPEWGCTSDSTELVYCYCGEGDACKWSSFGKCDGGAATCHLANDGSCGIGFGACC